MMEQKHVRMHVKMAEIVDVDVSMEMNYPFHLRE
jgi:hypothetical protein